MAVHVADTTDLQLIDEVLTVSDDEAMETARLLTRSLGVLAGVSSGAAVHAALRTARLPENAGRTIVTILPDTGERCLSVWASAPGADTTGWPKPSPARPHHPQERNGPLEPGHHTAARRRR